MISALYRPYRQILAVLLGTIVPLCLTATATATPNHLLGGHVGVHVYKPPKPSKPKQHRIAAVRTAPTVSMLQPPRTPLGTFHQFSDVWDQPDTLRPSSDPQFDGIKPTTLYLNTLGSGLPKVPSVKLPRIKLPRLPNMRRFIPKIDQDELVEGVIMGIAIGAAGFVIPMVWANDVYRRAKNDWLVSPAKRRRLVQQFWYQAQRGKERSEAGIQPTEKQRLAAIGSRVLSRAALYDVLQTRQTDPVMPTITKRTRRQRITTRLNRAVASPIKRFGRQFGLFRPKPRPIQRNRVVDLYEVGPEFEALAGLISVDRLGRRLPELRTLKPQALEMMSANDMFQLLDTLNRTSFNNAVITRRAKIAWTTTQQHWDVVDRYLNGESPIDPLGQSKLNTVVKAFTAWIEENDRFEETALMVADLAIRNGKQPWYTITGFAARKAWVATIANWDVVNKYMTGAPLNVEEQNNLDFVSNQLMQSLADSVDEPYRLGLNRDFVVAGALKAMIEGEQPPWFLRNRHLANIAAVGMKSTQFEGGPDHPDYDANIHGSIVELFIPRVGNDGVARTGSNLLAQLGVPGSDPKTIEHERTQKALLKSLGIE